MDIFENKQYEKCNIVENTSLFGGVFKDYTISTDILRRLSKDLGFSYELYITLSSIDSEAANSLVKSMSTESKHTEILLLVDRENSQILDYSLDTDRFPILNSDFIKRVSSLVETSDAITLTDLYYNKEDKISSVIIKKKDPITLEEKYENKDSKFISYNIGVLLVNDEISSASTRLVLYVDNHPLYLPVSYYNTATSRYKRSTSSSLEALEVVVLKIIDDLREDALKDKLYEIHYRYRTNKYILASYEEYNTLIRTMRKIPTIIEDNSILETLTSQYDEFEKKYAHVEDQKSSYIWRCTALTDLTVGALVSITSRILNDLYAPAIEYYAIRDLLGSYISTLRIADEIAKEDIR